MNQNKLLLRQIKKLLPAQLAAHPDLQKFLNAVNDSYHAYERDSELSARAFPISEEDYVAINRQLTQEINIRETSLVQLKETAGIITGSHSTDGSNDLLLISRYLNQQVGKRKNAEKVFTSLISNLQSGVLLEDENRKIVLCNQLFNTLFGIPLAPEALVGMDCTNSAQESKHLFKQPEQFVDRINKILANRKLVTGEILELADGRVFERDFIPIYVEQEYGGHLWHYTDITERKKATDALAKSELTNRLILNASLDAIIIIDQKGTINFWNPQAEKIFGWTEAQVLGKTLSQTIIPHAFRNMHEQGMNHYNATGEGPVLNKVLELTAVDIHGREFAVELSIVPIKKDNETVFCGFVRDIAERKKAENELKRLSLVASANINGVLFVQPDATITWGNEQFYNLTGYDKKEVIGSTLEQLLNGALTDQAVIGQMFNGGHDFKLELICYRKDGSWFWGELSGQSVKNEKGQVQEYFAVLKDITGEKEAQQKIAEFEQRFRMALEKIGDNVWEHDFSTGKTYFSNSSNKFLGLATTEATDNVALWWSHIHPDDRPLLEQNDQLYKGGLAGHHVLEYRVLPGDGSVRWVLDRGVVLEKTVDGRPLRIMGTHTDITEMKQAEQALRTNEEKYRNIIANMNLGMLEVDLNENIQYVNQSFCDISGYPADELLGKKASDLFAKGENKDKINQKNSLRHKGISDAYEMAIKDRRGNLRWWLISGAPRYNDKGELVGSVGIHLDITDQKNLEMDLIEAREQAEESSKSKEIFLANMSHEIRTPMNAILGMARQLQKTQLSHQQLFYLDTIQKGGEHLLVILNDILDISKIEAGALHLEQIGFRIQDILQQTVQVMHHRAQEKGLLLNYTITDTLPEILLGDPYRLKQVLLNLVSNAVKFTEKGSVKIDCGLLPPEDGAGICITVTDTGIGMEKIFVDNIFGKFLQEDKSITRKYGGTGLGMSISKQLVELMGGSIYIESEKNKGTTITLQLPMLAASAADLLPKDEGAVDTGILENKKILLVEDNEMNRLVATMILKHYGALITEAQNGSEAIAAIKASVYDLVLMDIQMPVMDGLEAAAIIREKLNSQVPIIALTANAIKGESQKCLDAGMNDYLSKPFEEEDLIRKIANCLGNDPIFIEQRSKDQPAATTLYSLNKLKDIARGNEDFIKTMTALFAEQAVQAIREIKTALAVQNYGAIKATAHRIKSSIDNMDIVSLKTEIRQIEGLAGQNGPLAELEPLVGYMEKVLLQVVAELRKLP